MTSNENLIVETMADEERTAQFVRIHQSSQDSAIVARAKRRLQKSSTPLEKWGDRIARPLSWFGEAVIRMGQKSKSPEEVFVSELRENCPNLASLKNLEAIANEVCKNYAGGLSSVAEELVILSYYYGEYEGLVSAAKKAVEAM